jgi:hypothetical protein
LRIRRGDPCFGGFDLLRRGGLLGAEARGFALCLRHRLFELGRLPFRGRLLGARLAERGVERLPGRLRGRACRKEQRGEEDRAG